MGALFSAPVLAGAQAPAPRVGIAATRAATGYWVAAADGGVYRFGDAGFHGSLAGKALNQPVTGVAATPSGRGYWLAAGDGGVFSFGDAVFRGSQAGKALNQPVVGMAATPSGAGYWLAAGDGGVFAFGDAVFHGAMAGTPLNRPVVGIAATPSGRGYWLAAGDGGVFAFGDAAFSGSLASTPLNQPVVGIAATPSGGGYWLAAGDGGVFAFGDAVFHGSLAGTPLNQPVVGIVATPSGGGYWLVARDGGVFSFGDARFQGSALEPADPTAQLRGCAARRRGPLIRVQLWSRAGCGAASVLVRYRGDGDRPNFRRFRDADGKLRDVDNALSSAIIGPSACVRFFDGADYRGAQSALLCAGTEPLRVDDLGAFNNRISSMRVCRSSRRSHCARGDTVVDSVRREPPPDPPTVAGGGPPEPPRGLRYVALGDSYSAGEGVEPYLDGTDTKTNSCHRSTRAYPRLLRVGALPPELLFFACGGAETPDVLEQIKQGAPGTPDVPALKSADLVTITIGGNDMKFSDVITECFLHACLRRAIVKDTYRRVRSELPGKLRMTYAAIRKDIRPDTVVVVLGYPHPFPKGLRNAHCLTLAGWSRGEQNFMRDANNEMNEIIKREAELVGFRYLDGRAAFSDHEICAGKRDWINSISDPDILRRKVGGASFHPNTAGQAGYAAALEDFLKSTPLAQHAGK